MVANTRHLSLTERAYKSIEERIVTLQFAPGQLLSEHSLSAQLKIGRTPIREALQRLARDGWPHRSALTTKVV